MPPDGTRLAADHMFVPPEGTNMPHDGAKMPTDGAQVLRDNGETGNKKEGV